MCICFVSFSSGLTTYFQYVFLLRIVFPSLCSESVLWMSVGQLWFSVYPRPSLSRFMSCFLKNYQMRSFQEDKIIVLVCIKFSNARQGTIIVEGWVYSWSLILREKFKCNKCLSSRNCFIFLWRVLLGVNCKHLECSSVCVVWIVFLRDRKALVNWTRGRHSVAQIKSRTYL